MAHQELWKTSALARSYNLWTLRISNNSSLMVIIMMLFRYKKPLSGEMMQSKEIKSLLPWMAWSMTSAMDVMFKSGNKYNIMKSPR